MKKTAAWAFTLTAGAIALVGGYLVLERMQNENGYVNPVVDVASRLSPAAVRLIGTPAPEFSMPDLAGDSPASAHWKGKVILLNFWASWCPPCLKEIPVIVELQENYREQGFQAVGIALDRESDVEKFAAKIEVNYPILVGLPQAVDLSRKLGNPLGVLPYNVLIDRAGIIRLIRPGEWSADELEAVLLDYL